MRVGAKDFDEQRVLAHMLAELAHQGRKRAIVVECGDTFGCQSDMRDGRVDVMVEYSGTVSVLSGGADAADSRERIERELGIRWLGELGFDNAYEMVVPTARAVAQDLQAIGDLAKLEGGIRVAVPSTYARRPGDGLFPLLRRYGLELAEPPLLLDDPGARYEAVLGGHADAAVAYTTDAALDGRRLRVLEDPLEFFPDYRASVIARTQAVDHHPELHELADELAGRLDDTTMRRLNARVQMQGDAPASVAVDFLRAEGLVHTAAAAARETELYVVSHVEDSLSAATGRALRAADRAFPRRQARSRRTHQPLEELADGSARIAVVGSERFFHTEPDGEVQRDPRAEAVAVIGTRLLHLVRRQRSRGGPWRGRIGIPPEGSGAAKAATSILALEGTKPAAHGSTPELLEQVHAGKLDGALMLTEAPDPAVAEALARRPGLTLRDITTAQRATGSTRIPYIRAARITAGTYPRQQSAVETLQTQVLIAGPSAQSGGARRVGGPAAALRTAGSPLSESEVEALVTATPVQELPDPVLPSPWSVGSQARGSADGLSHETIDTMLNVVAWALLAWLLALLYRSRSSREGAS